MPGTLLRRIAEGMLRAGILLAPAEARDWGNAMLGELQHIEGSWAAVAWALGGARVLAKQSLIAFLLPLCGGQSAPVGNPLSEEGKMHKASLIMGGACLAVVLLFFLAPVFRQGFRVSLAQWNNVADASQSLFYSQTELESLARRAEKNDDAEGMAFVSARLNNREESVRLANEAVRLAPKIIWIWGVVGARHAGAPDVPGWADKLKQSDPGNALPYLILAQREDIQVSTRSVGGLFHPLQPNGAWLQAMAGAFGSRRIDDYTERLQALDRKVALRYGLSDPYLVVERGIAPSVPSYLLADSFRYAKLTLASGDKLEASGDAKGAIEKYLKVTHFVHMVDAYNNFPPFVNRIMPDVYTRLAAIYKKTGNGPQSAYYTDLAVTTTHSLERRHRQEHSAILNRLSIFGVTAWNALVVELSNVGMLAAFCLLLIALIAVLARSRTLRPSELRMGPVATALGFLGSVGLLVSSMALYVAYRPYAAIYSNFLYTGDTSHLTTLRTFLESTRSPLGTQIYHRVPGHHGAFAISPYVSTHTFTFYFWLAVAMLGVAILAAIGGWHLLRRFHHRVGAPASGQVAG
jgi:tetratricopeptide (TPR) repeat protein